MTDQIQILTEQMGGSEWKSTDGSKHRVYFNNLNERSGVRYGMTVAEYLGRETAQEVKYSDSEVANMIRTLNSSKIWFDLSDSSFHSQTDTAWMRESEAKPVVLRVRQSLQAEYETLTGS